MANSGVALLADDFRIPKEKKVLFTSISIMMLFLLFVFKINPLIPIIGFTISALWIKIEQKQLLGNTVKVNSTTIPKIYDASKNVAEKLSMEVPDVFIKQSPILNAYAIGVFGKKSVVLHSELVKVMNDDELYSILGHEFSHIKCKHTIWNTITGTTNMISIPIVSKFFEFIFLYWSRLAEYSADRGGLIACENLKATTSSFIKLAVGEDLASEVNVDDFIEQVEKDKVATQMVSFLLTHPYLADRIKGLSEFYSSEQYKQISSGDIQHGDSKISKNLYQISQILSQNIKKSNLTTDKFATLLRQSKFSIIPPKINEQEDTHIFNIHEQHNIDNCAGEADFSEIDIDNGESTLIEIEEHESVPQKENISNQDLFFAVLNDDIESVNQLLELGIDPETQDKEWDTPLHIAVQLGNINIAESLLKAGASIHKENKKKETPLLIAENSDDVGIMNLLLKYDHQVNDE